jgi:Tfp pilus assembly protein PilV
MNMQARALMDNQDAYLRTQAVFLAYDMTDRIRANHEYWKNNIAQNKLDDIIDIAKGFKSPGNGNPQHPFCSAYDPQSISLAEPLAVPSACTEKQMAESDTYRWLHDVSNILPEGSVSISNVDDPHTTATTKDIIRLTITWERVNKNLPDQLKNNASYFLDVRL